MGIIVQNKESKYILSKKGKSIINNLYFYIKIENIPFLILGTNLDNTWIQDEVVDCHMDLLILWYINEFQW